MIVKGLSLLSLAPLGFLAWLISPEAEQLPAIAKDLPRNFEEASDVFEQRVKREFPVPLPEAAVSSLLAQQSFTVDEKSNTARFIKQGLPCDLIWRVYWNEDQGIVTEIRAIYFGICL